MMISPEYFYENELKGKTPEEIAKKIRGLKRKIGHLKRLIEHPDYCTDFVIICPDENVQLYYTRLYLKRAIVAFEEAGGTYVLNKNEQRVAAFDATIPMITKIVFSIGGFDGRTIHTITFDGLYVKLEKQERGFPVLDIFELDPPPPLTKEEFLEKFRDIHMGEWHKEYFNRNVLDGTQWNITIEYADGQTVRYGGSNAFPFSFNQFCELVEYEEESEEEPENDCDDE